MSEEEKPKKRVGSWREYRTYVSKIGILTISGIGLIFLGGLCLFVVYCMILSGMGKVYSWGFVIPFALIFGGLFSVLAWLGHKSLLSTQKIHLVTPPTRENLASLPAEDVLVRASAEPTEEAGKTLLRGAVKDGETPAEELLRPTLER